MARWRWILLVLASNTPLGCGDGRAPEPASTPSSSASPKTTDASPFRFAATLEQHLPQGAVGRPVVELSLPRKHTVVMLAAVLRKDAAGVQLERWTFEQTPGEEELRLVEGGEALVRLGPGSRHPELGDLRRSMATPRAVLTRPVGLAEDPKAVVDQLVAAFATLDDPNAKADARVDAAATVMRGLDDAVVFERDAAATLGDLLDPPPQATEVETLSKRRAKATLTLDGRTATLELQRKADGWAVASFDAPPPPKAAGTTGSAGESGPVVPL